MAFINKKTDGVPIKDTRRKNTVHVKRGYYTFSKYYPAGDTNRVYRKSISRARKEKRAKLAAAISAAIAALAAAIVFFSQL